MLLCLDVGNSHIFGGIFIDTALRFTFRYPSKQFTSDECGIFLRNVLRENQFDPKDVTAVAICSVVPQLDYSLRAACVKYFNQEPFFLEAGVKTGLNIKYRNPVEVGSDRIANAIGAIHQFPQKDLIIIDFGTAITFCVVTAERDYRGGVIMPGLRVAMESLQANTAKLPVVEILKPDQVVGRSTVDSIQSGLYFGSLGACREIINRLQKDLRDPIVIATGGFSGLFASENIYSMQIPDLVLQGLRLAWMKAST